MNARGFPFARVKRIVAADGDVAKVSHEAVFLLGVAAELFVAKLAAEAHQVIKFDKRKTLMYKDLSKTVAEYSQFDFLREIVPVIASQQKAVFISEEKVVHESETIAEDSIETYDEVIETFDESRPETDLETQIYDK